MTEAIDEVVKRFRIKPVDLTEDDVKQYLEPPQHFVLWSHVENYGEYYKTRAVGPTVVHRESDSATRSDRQVMEAYLRALPFEEGKDWEFSRVGHPAVGWCEKLSFRVLEKDGSVTQIARHIHGIFEKQKEYVVLDEDHWTELEWEEKEEDCSNVLQDLLGREPTEQEWEKIFKTRAWDTRETGVDSWEEMKEALSEAGIEYEA